MTEAEWLSCADSNRMFASLCEAGKAPLHKVRRLFSACCRRLQDDHFCEQIGDGTEAIEADHAERDWLVDGETTPPESDYPDVTCDPIAFTDFGFVLHLAVPEALRTLDRRKTEKIAAASLLREIFGNPFRPASLDPAILQWNDGAIVKLAQAIYTDRSFDRLPILADHLEAAGCDNADILNHCRGPGPHVRGCWVVDLVLGKE